eukprot:TRINITY_DN4847_c0_g2_i1.p1 TRINITY_DN4847_c0_g2~~TRINITY_DN4847_c0_g2_i1.p1  ORF type:complete len:123 (+),score=31.39 TRINITY_DN4847_c0_g2_i1:201-569(+)
MADKDKDGGLSKEEYRDLAKVLFEIGVRDIEEQIKAEVKLRKAGEAFGKPTVTLETRVKVVSSNLARFAANETNLSNYTATTFNKADSDQDGMVSFAEFHQFLIAYQKLRPHERLLFKDYDL